MLDRLIFTGERLIDLQRFAGSGAGAAGGDGASSAPAGGQQAGEGEAPSPFAYVSERTKARRARQAQMNTAFTFAQSRDSRTDTKVTQDGGTEPSADDTASSGATSIAADDGQPAAPARKTLDQLMAEDPELKKEFQQKFDKNWGERHKEAKRTAETMDRLHAMFGTSDLDGLNKAIDGESEFNQFLADSQGMTREQFQEKVKTDAENRRLNRELKELRGIPDQRADSRTIEQRTQALIDEEARLKQLIPGFSIASERASSETGQMFSELVRTFERCGHKSPVEAAYRAVHGDAILSEAVQQVQRQTEQRVIGNIQARGSRPRENASGTSAPAQSAFAQMSGRSKEAREARRQYAKNMR